MAAYWISGRTCTTGRRGTHLPPSVGQARIHAPCTGAHAVARRGRWHNVGTAATRWPTAAPTHCADALRRRCDGDRNAGPSLFRMQTNLSQIVVQQAIRHAQVQGDALRRRSTLRPRCVEPYNGLPAGSYTPQRRQCSPAEPASRAAGRASRCAVQPSVSTNLWMIHTTEYGQMYTGSGLPAHNTAEQRVSMMPQISDATD
jgi:hypothetical protein